MKPRTVARIKAKALLAGSPALEAVAPDEWITAARRQLAILSEPEPARGSARARHFRGERDELLRLGRELIETVPMTPGYIRCLQAFAKAVYRERMP